MGQKMDAVVMTGANKFSIKEVDVPEPGPGEVQVEIKAILICGSDPKVFNGSYLSIGWPPAFPFIPGHEFSGIVSKLGEGVTKFAVGDRVAGEAHCGCGVCNNCMAGNYNLCLNYGKTETGHRHYGFRNRGAYAQYNTYHVKALTKMPDNVSFDEASLADTAGTSLQAVRLTGIVPGGYTLVIGPGPIGIFVMQIAKAMGSKTIIVGRRARLALSGKMGADYQIAVFGSRANPNCTQDVLNLMSIGQITAEEMITHTFLLKEFAKALEIFSERLDGAMKVVVHPGT